MLFVVNIIIKNCEFKVFMKRNNNYFYFNDGINNLIFKRIMKQKELKINTLQNTARQFSKFLVFSLIALVGMLLTSCSHLYFDSIQPKGGELQNEIPIQIQGNYSKWCFSNEDGTEVCYDEKELLSADTVAVKSLFDKDTNIIYSMFFKIDSKTIEIKSLMNKDLNGIHKLNEDIYLSRINDFFILNFKVDSKQYTKQNGKSLKKELYECYAFELDSSGITKIFFIDPSVPLLKKTKTIIPSGSGEAAYISRKSLTKRNLAKVMYAHPLRYILLNKKNGSVNRIEMNEDAGMQCGESRTIGLKYRMRKVKLNQKGDLKQNTKLSPVKFN